MAKEKKSGKKESKKKCCEKFLKKGKRCNKCPDGKTEKK